MWEYRAAVERVVDGDTLDVDIDLGFGIVMRERVRLAGVDTPEMRTPLGPAARLFVIRWIQERSPEAEQFPLVLRSKKPDPRDKYGRYLAEVVRGEESLGADLLAAGLARVAPWGS